MEIKRLYERPSALDEYVRELRDVTRQGDRMRFRYNLERIGMLMAYEVSRVLPYEPVDVVTPLGEARCRRAAVEVVVGTILRAGLPMHQGVLGVFDGAANCFEAAWRSEGQAGGEVAIHLGYTATAPLDGKVLVVADPMLATGQSMAQTLEMLLRHGRPRHIHILSVIASEPGVAYLAGHELPVPATLWLAAVDPGLDERCYIVPGLGDAGDLAFGEKE